MSLQSVPQETASRRAGRACMAASYGWTSPDGRHWSALPKPAGYPVIPYASDGQRIVGESYIDRDQLGLWGSTDGASWQPLTATGATDQMPAW